MNKCMFVFQFESIDTEENVFYLGDGGLGQGSSS